MIVVIKKGPRGDIEAYAFTSGEVHVVDDFIKVCGDGKELKFYKDSVKHLKVDGVDLL